MKLYNEEELKSSFEANGGRTYQQCSISVMDTISDPNISFDEKGVSNYYEEFKHAKKHRVFNGEIGKTKLEAILNEIKLKGKGKKYDCITGVSGGVDSTYVALKAKEFGLNPLIVHFDNGWNSEMANQNINNIISKLGFDLYTLVVDWNEFKDLQRAYFKANVVDIEALTDHAIITTLFQLAKKYKINYILSGSNIVTEYTLPKAWVWGKTDGINIKDIHDHFGTVKLKTYPILSSLKRELLRVKDSIESIDILNYLEYDKEKVKLEIADKLNWQDYGGKHYESIFTRFYQGYILPVKFGIDKRKAHLSTLIFDGKITKDFALNELKKPIYPSSELLQQDYDFVIKKLGFTKEEFNEYLSAKPVAHDHYKFDKKNIWLNYPVLKPFSKVWRAIKAK